MKKQEPGMTEIPIELIEEILMRFTVVDLLRFRCVSKKWRNLIDSPNFVKSHSNLPNKTQSVLVIDHEQRICYFDLDSVSNANSPANLKELGKPSYGIYSYHNGVLGHINGLVCCSFDRERGVSLCNPWTMKYIHVPPPVEKSRIWSGTVYWSWGFGYDRDSDDYKVLALASLMTGRDAIGRTLVWIYSLRSGSWRRLDDSPYSLSGYRQDVVFLDGVFYWRVDSPSDRRRYCLIYALHLGKLEYNLVPPPNLSGGSYVSRLGVLDGCLSATCFPRFSLTCDLWVMKEYGVKDSWTKLMQFRGNIIPLGFSMHSKRQ